MNDAQTQDDQKWITLYQQELQNRGGERERTKLEICEAGMAYFDAKTHNWTSSTAVPALRGLMGNGNGICDQSGVFTWAGRLR